MAVIFDLDGTLIDSLPTIAKAGNAVLAGADLSPLPVDRYRAFVGLGEQVLLDRLIAATDLDAGQRDHLMIQFMNSYKAASQDTHLFDGVPAALEAVKKLGQIGLCTNKPMAALGVVLQTLGWQDMFDVVIAGDTLPVRKPEPEPLQLAVERLGTKTGLYVGDSETDAETAQRAGVPFALFTKGIRVSPVDQIPHDVAFDDFAALPDIVKAYL